MKLESLHIWKCDTCDKEGAGEESYPPKSWRQFRLLEQHRANEYYVIDKWVDLVAFCICDKCHGDVYHNMPPVRKALSIAGVFKKK